MSTGGAGRSPSWGAWIEIKNLQKPLDVGICRSPSWGAWIEIYGLQDHHHTAVSSLPLVGSVD